MRQLLRCLGCACVLTIAVAGCGGSETFEPDPVSETRSEVRADPDPTTVDQVSATPTVPSPTPVVPQVTPAAPPTRSDRVPSVDELLATGLDRTEAECFIAEIDPDETGRFSDPDLFAQAMARCFEG